MNAEITEDITYLHNDLSGSVKAASNSAGQLLWVAIRAANQQMAKAGRGVEAAGNATKVAAELNKRPSSFRK